MAAIIENWSKTEIRLCSHVYMLRGNNQQTILRELAIVYVKDAINKTTTTTTTTTIITTITSTSTSATTSIQEVYK